MREWTLNLSKSTPVKFGGFTCQSMQVLPNHASKRALQYSLDPAQEKNTAINAFNVGKWICLALRN
jgi:hypothetical protein